VNGAAAVPGPTLSFWAVGLLPGLRDGGADATEADLILGTSAGSVVAAQISGGAALDDLYAELIAPAKLTERKMASTWSPSSGLDCFHVECPFSAASALAVAFA
jgi:predicted acylesterase/phospholipase RssA